MPSTNQLSSPVALVKAFLGCVSTKDGAQMRKLAHPNATACLIRENKPNFKPLTETIEVLEKAPQDFVEVTWDEVEHVDGDYATVWTKFNIHRDGEVCYTLVVPGFHCC